MLLLSGFYEKPELDSAFISQKISIFSALKSN